MRFWTLSGSQENWDRGISDNIWGVREGLKQIWEKMSKGDILIFYVTSPISGVIGIGKLESKFKQDKPLWPDEIRANKVIYPYRFEFKVEYVLPMPSWEKGKIKISDLNVNIRGGVNSLINKEVIKTLFERADSSWNTELSKLIEIKVEEKKEKPTNLHDELKKEILEIGSIERFISEKEYPMNRERLDVVWRRVAGSVPTYVFEIQIGGNLHQALSKLKHAHDIWNSNIFLVAQKDDLTKANQLLSGTFHEIERVIKIWTPEKVKQLYKAQSEDLKIKEEMGLP